jgi:hypothetical protein
LNDITDLDLNSFYKRIKDIIEAARKFAKNDNIKRKDRYGNIRPFNRVVKDNIRNFIFKEEGTSLYRIIRDMKKWYKELKEKEQEEVKKEEDEITVEEIKNKEDEITLQLSTVKIGEIKLPEDSNLNLMLQAGSKGSNPNSNRKSKSKAFIYRPEPSAGRKNGGGKKCN